MMTPARTALKLFLLQERVIERYYIADGRQKYYKGLICELCVKKYVPGATGPLFVPGLDLHEVIISRGNVRGVERLKEAVTESKYNSALVCNDCNLNRADTKWASAHLTRLLVGRYGAEPILAWIESLGLKVPQPYIQAVLIAAEAAKEPNDSKNPAVQQVLAV